MKCKSCGNEIKKSDVNCPHCGTTLKQKENVLMGTIGALIGSLAGVVLIVLLGQIGFVASIAGLVMAYACLYMYEKMGGSISVVGIIICIVIMIGMTVLAENISCSIAIARELGVSASDVFKNFYDIIGITSDVKAAYIKELLMVFLFNVIGCFGVIRTKIDLIKNK